MLTPARGPSHLRAEASRCAVATGARMRGGEPLPACAHSLKYVHEGKKYFPSQTCKHFFFFLVMLRTVLLGEALGLCCLQRCLVQG